MTGVVPELSGETQRTGLGFEWFDAAEMLDEWSRPWLTKDLSEVGERLKSDGWKVEKLGGDFLD